MVCFSKMCRQEADPLWERYAIWDDCASWIAEAQDYAFVMKDYVKNQEYMELQDELKDFYDHTNNASLVKAKKSICVLIKDYYIAKKKIKTYGFTREQLDKRAWICAWNRENPDHYEMAMEYLIYSMRHNYNGTEKMASFCASRLGEGRTQASFMYDLLENGGIDYFEHELAESIPKIEAEKVRLAKTMIKMKVGKIYEDVKKGKTDEQIEKEEMELELEYEEVLYATVDYQDTFSQLINSCGSWKELEEYNEKNNNIKNMCILQRLLDVAAT